MRVSIPPHPVYGHSQACQNQSRQWGARQFILMFRPKTPLGCHGSVVHVHHCYAFLARNPQTKQNYIQSNSYRLRNSTGAPPQVPYTHTHTDTYRYIHRHIWTHRHIHRGMQIYTHAYNTDKHACTHVHIHTYRDTQIYHTHMHIFMGTYMHAYTYTNTNSHTYHTSASACRLLAPDICLGQILAKVPRDLIAAGDRCGFSVSLQSDHQVPNIEQL